MDSVYIVGRSGVHCYDLVGIYEDQEIAKIAMLKAKDLEKDNYHSFSVRKMKLNNFHNINDYGSKCDCCTFVDTHEGEW